MLEHFGMMHHRSVTVRKWLLRWRWRTQHSLAQAAELEHAATYHTRHLIARTVQQWRSVTRRRVQYAQQRVDATIHNNIRLARWVLGSLGRAVARGQHLDQLAQQVLQDREHYSFKTVFEGWRDWSHRIADFAAAQRQRE